MSAIPDSTLADCQQLVADLQRQLTECRAERDEALEYQTATSDVLNVISRSTADVQPVLDTVVETAARLCGADIGSLAVREGEVYRPVSSSFSASEPEYWAIMRQRRIVPGRDSVSARVALEGRVVHVEDLAADPDFAVPEAVAAGRRTYLGVPLLRDREPIGMITLTRKRVEPFTERQIELVRTFADQAVIAIENARLITETREALEQQTATAEVLQVINSSPGDLAPVFDAMVEKAIDLCGAAYGYMYTYDGELTHPAAMRGDPRFVSWWREQGARVPDPGSPLERAVRGEPVVHIADARQAEAYRTSPVYKELVDLGGIRTGIIVALRKDNTFLGSIHVFRREVRPFSEKQLALLETFADQAVIAIENARLLGELQARTRDLEESLEYQTATSDVLNVISRSTADVQPVLDTVIETAVRLCGADGGGIALSGAEVSDDA